MPAAQGGSSSLSLRMIGEFSAMKWLNFSTQSEPPSATDSRRCVRETAGLWPARCISAVPGCNDDAVARRRLLRLEIGRCRPETGECGAAVFGEQTEPMENRHLRQLRMQLKALPKRILGRAVGIPHKTDIVRG